MKRCQWRDTERQMLFGALQHGVWPGHYHPQARSVNSIPLFYFTFPLGCKISELVASGSSSKRQCPARHDEAILKLISCCLYVFLWAAKYGNLEFLCPFITYRIFRPRNQEARWHRLVDLQTSPRPPAIRLSRTPSSESYA